MIEQGELNCLQQRQIRDFSFKLQSMARLQTHIKDVTRSKHLIAEKRLNYISTNQI